MTVKFHTKERWIIKLSVILWVSFLWAGIATTLFFATFDPVEIAKVATFPMTLTRASGYSIGFLLFWMLLFISNSIASWLIDRNPNSIEQQND